VVLKTNGHFVSVKELAQLMGLHPVSVKRWWKRLDVPPTVQIHHCHRWSPEDAQKLLDRWSIFGLRQQMHAKPLNNGHPAGNGHP